MCFVIGLDKNLAAARRFDGKCLENSRENFKKVSRALILQNVVFHYKYNAKCNMQVAWRYHNAA